MPLKENYNVLNVNVWQTYQDFVERPCYQPSSPNKDDKEPVFVDMYGENQQTRIPEKYRI